MMNPDGSPSRSPSEATIDKADVTELVLFSGFALNEAESRAFQTVQGIDGCHT
jgi:hypothetical protein